MLTTMFALFALTLTQHECPEPDVWLDRSLPKAERGWATASEKAQVRRRMVATWKAMGFGKEAQSVLLAIVKRESFNGDTCAVCVLGPKEYGLGAGCLGVKFHKPKWDAEAPDWVMRVPEVNAVVMGRIFRRAKWAHKARSYLRFGQIYGGRIFKRQEDRARDAKFCWRLDQRGVDCRDPIGLLGKKLGSGPTEDQVVFVLELQAKAEAG
jgi:hypothetical protein